MQNKIFLDASGELAVTDDGLPMEAGAGQRDAGPTLDDLL
jgi:hypothetical protein